MPAMTRPGFFTKAGLRTLLTSDEVWTFGKKRSSGEQISEERKTLETAGAEDSSDLKSLAKYSYQNLPCHRTTFERKLKREGLQSAHQPEPYGHEHENEENVKSHSHKAECHEKVNTTNISEQHSSKKIQYPTEVTWNPLKKEHNFTSVQISCRISDRAPIVSSLSSDIEDLPYDSDDSIEKLGEKLNCGDVITDNSTLNVQNIQRSQIALLNNNHRICDELNGRKTESNVAHAQTHDPHSVSQIARNTTEFNLVEPVIENSIQAQSTDMNRGEESPSCDDSFSEIEEQSEQFSLQSEEERDVLSEEKTDAFSLVYAEKFIVVPKSSLYSHQSIANIGRHGHSHYEKAESVLSEILSPVDEVLSYGSAELPSLKGGSGSGLLLNTFLHPPPAFEIITWTSEEDLPAPKDFVEDISINSENIPPLPADVSLLKCDSDSLREMKINNDVTLNDTCTTPPPAQSTDPDQEDDGSEYTSSLPLDDPLSSFHIGDRVFVCNSRPGVLKYKGYPAFADGFWAGVALDMPDGNLNGMFKGVKYFTCEKNYGVLVRSEDISYLCEEHYSDRKIGHGKGIFSDKDPASGYDAKNMNRSSGNGEARHKNGQRSSGHDSPGSKQTFKQEPCVNNRSASDSRSSRISPLKTDRELVCCNGDIKDHVIDSDPVMEKLTQEIFAGAWKNEKDIGFKFDSKDKAINPLKNGSGNFRTNKTHLMDQWQQVCPVTPPQIWAKPHEHSIVHRLVEVTAEIIFGLENKDALEACETPSFLVDDESRKTYRQVLFDLASDILHEVMHLCTCANVLEMRGSFLETKNKPEVSVLQTRDISVDLLKATVKRETHKVLNVERTDQQMTEMLQALCKYWYAKRDHVDYVLIQELHSEEKQWVDYSSDQITVQIQLAEEIFNLLLDDTISVLSHIYTHNK